MKFSIYLNRHIFVMYRIARSAKVPHVDNKDSNQPADAQACLSICYRHMSESTFSHVVAQKNISYFQRNANIFKTKDNRLM